MDKNTYKELKSLLKQIKEELKKKDITKEERDALELQRVKIAGSLMSSWLPFGKVRKLFFLLFILIGVYGLINWNFLFSLIPLILATMMSPRLIAEFISRA